MSFVHPAFAWLALGLMALPPLLHLLARRRYREVPWAAMAFLAAAHRQSRRRMRIEQWLLMGLRMLIIAVLGLALSRPALPGSSAFARAVGEPRSDRVLLIDDTLSMQAAAPGGTVFETARAAAIRLLDTFPPNDGVAIVSIARPARALIDRPTIDRALLRQTLADLQPSAIGGDLSEAVATAREVISHGTASPENRSIYVLSDLARSTWTTPAVASQTPTSPLAAATADASISTALDQIGLARNRFIINVGVEERDNLCVAALEPLARPTQRRGAWRIEATITNYGVKTSPAMELDVAVGSATGQRVPVAAMSAGEVRRIAIPLRVLRVGPHIVSVRLQGVADALALDNQRLLAIEATGQRPLLIVTDQAHVLPETDPGFYVNAVFAPGESSAAPFESRRIAATELPSVTLDAFASVILAGMPRVAPAQWRRLEQYVSNGGGLLFVMGQDAVPSEYDQPWLPGHLSAMRTINTDSSHGVETTLRVIQPLHPAIADTVLHRGGGLMEAAFSSHARWQPRQGTSRQPVPTVLLSFHNDDAALVVGSYRNGRMAWWTTTLDMMASSLPAKPDFVPFMQNLIVWLSTGDESRRNITVGAEWRSAMPVTAEGRAPTVRRPDGTEDSAVVSDRPLEGDDRRTWTYSRTDLPGRYSALDERMSEDFVATLDTSESDLSAIGEDELRRMAGADLQYIASADELLRPSTDSPRRELSAALVTALFVFVLGESLLAAWFGRRA